MRDGGVAKGPVRLWMIYMQRIYPTSLTRQYAEQEYHKQVRPPENCPIASRRTFGRAGLLPPLYHHRTAPDLLIWVRRFCAALSHQRQLLPQLRSRIDRSYATIAAGFQGEAADPRFSAGAIDWSLLRGLKPIAGVAAPGGQRLWSVALQATATVSGNNCASLRDLPRHAQLVHQFHTVCSGLTAAPTSAASGCMRAARAGARRRLTPTHL